MEFHILGIGIIYLGKRNIQYFFSNCHFCGKFSKIASYDITAYLSILIPLFPINDRKIIKCHRCYKKKDESLKDFQANKKNDQEPIFKEYLDDPHSDPKAEKLLVVLMKYYDKEGFLGIIAKIKRVFQNEAALMAAIGDTYLFFTYLQDAERSYLSSLSNDNNPVVREKLGLTLILQSHPSEAWPYLDHIINQRKEKGLWLLSLLVGSFQANGMHQEALNILAFWKDSFPEYILYQKHLRVSQKYAGNKRKIRSKLLATFSKAVPKKGISATTAHFFAVPFYPLLLVLLVIIIHIAYTEATEGKIYLVNGLNRAYQVKINDHTYWVQKLSNKSISLLQGHYTIKTADGSLRFSPLTLEIKINYDGWNRPVLVVNLDRLALITQEQRRYYYLTRQEELPLKLFYGKSLYRFKKVDAFFTSSQGPKGISLLQSCTPKGVLQSRLHLWNTLEPTGTIKLLEKYLDQNERNIYFQRYLRNIKSEKSAEVYQKYLE
jgi:hypothetical protein